MTESEFLGLADSTLSRIETCFDNLNDMDVVDVECKRNGNVLEIEFIANGSKIIVNDPSRNGAKPITLTVVGVLDPDARTTTTPTSPEIYTPTDALCALEQLPAGILNEPLNVLCPGEVIGDNPIVDTGDPIGCEDFRIVTTTIVNGNFTLQWTPVEGATRYEISTVDENGRELALLHSNSASLFTNGGANFPPAGYVDVRAFNGDEYLCYARLDYQRVDSTVSGPAPSTSLSGASPSCVSGGTYSVTIINDVPCTITGTFAGNAFNIAPGGSQGFSVPGGNQTLIVNSCPGFAGTTASYCIDTDSAITVYVP